MLLLHYWGDWTCVFRLRMQGRNLELAKQLVDEGYIEQSRQARSRVEKEVRVLLSQRRIPDMGWSEIR